MKNEFRFLSFLVAVFMILGSISFNGISFADNPNQYSIKTTDASGNVVNMNHYDNKSDVYVRIDGDNITNYWVIVESPNGTFLGSGGPFAAGVLFNLYDATNFSDTTNNGGVYKVGVSRDEGFHASNTKYDTFKVGKTPPDPINDGAISIEKKIDGGDKDELFEFTLIGPGDMNELFYLKHGDQKDFSGLPLGEYTLTEVLPNGYTNNLPSNPFTFWLTEENKTKELGVINKKNDTTPEWKNGKVIVTKTKLGRKGKWGI